MSKRTNSTSSNTEKEWEGGSSLCDIGPYGKFQATTEAPPPHQIGQVVLKKETYRPLLTRVVVNGFSRGLGSNRPRQHSHDVYHLFAPKAGTLHVLAGNERLAVPAGKVLALSPGEPHALQTEKEACVWSAVTFQYLSSRNNAPLTVSFHALLECMAGRALPQQKERAFAIPEAGPSYIHDDAAEMIRTACSQPLEAAATLQRLLIRCTEWKERQALPGPDARLEEIHARIQREFREPLSLDRLALEASMSRRALTRRFKARFGTTLKGLQIQLRLDAASLMLRTTDLQIQEIAEEVGYSDLYQFTTAFKKRRGMAPTAFRKSL